MLPRRRGMARPSYPLIALCVLAGAYTLYLARTLLMPLVLASLFALVLSPAMRLLRQLRVPDAASAAGLAFSLVAGLGLCVYLLAQPAAEWAQRAPEGLRQVEFKLRALTGSLAGVQRMTEKIEELARLDGGNTPEVSLRGPGLAGQVVNRTEGFLVGLVATIALLYFLLAAGDLFLRKLVRVLPRFRDKVHAVAVVQEAQREIAFYLLGIVCINVGLGCATGVAMFVLGMPNPALWGVVVCVLNFIPYIGAATSFTILTLVALLSFDQIGRALLAPGAFLILATLEGQFLTPTILGKRHELNPVVMFIAVMFWAWIWGPLGAFVAVPVLVTLKVWCNHSERLAPIGEFLGPD
jgi:predicted PurR-regulated permease PerM